MSSCFSSHRMKSKMGSWLKSLGGGKGGKGGDGGDSEQGGTQQKGLGVAMTSFFLVAQMAGAGFLSLPKALANTGGHRIGV